MFIDAPIDAEVLTIPELVILSEALIDALVLSPILTHRCARDAEVICRLLAKFQADVTLRDEFCTADYSHLLGRLCDADVLA